MKLFSSILLLAGFAPMAFAQEPAQDDPTLDITLVIINDAILTSSMVEVSAARMLFRQPGMSEEQIRSTALIMSVRKLLFEDLFVNLGFDAAMLDPQIQQRMDQLILEDGSRAGFEESLRRDGYHHIGEFRNDLRDSYIQNTVTGVLGGSVPSPTQGFRTLAQPTPEEIRKAYESNESYRRVESKLNWVQLQFFAERGKSPAAERAATVAGKLADHSMTAAEAMEAADRIQRNSGIRSGMKQEIVDFLDFEGAGAVLPLGNNQGDVAQLVLILDRTEAQEFSFQDAQMSIKKDLTNANREKSIVEALVSQYRQSYIWINPELEGLSEFLNELYGPEKTSLESAEL